jgi:hypothetical protein
MIFNLFKIYFYSLSLFLIVYLFLFSRTLYEGFIFSCFRKISFSHWQKIILNYRFLSSPSQRIQCLCNKSSQLNFWRKLFDYTVNFQWPSLVGVHLPANLWMQRNLLWINLFILFIRKHNINSLSVHFGHWQPISTPVVCSCGMAK